MKMRYVNRHVKEMGGKQNNRRRIEAIKANETIKKFKRK